MASSSPSSLPPLKIIGEEDRKRKKKRGGREATTKKQAVAPLDRSIEARPSIEIKLVFLSLSLVRPAALLLFSTLAIRGRRLHVFETHGVIN